MFGIFKKLLGGGESSAQAVDEPAIEHNGFTIVAAPQQGEGGWSTEAVISKELDGETKTHHFIRADKTGSRDGAVELTLNKCRQTIDQLGERIFS